MSTALQSARHVVSQSCGRSAEVAACLLKPRTHKMAKPKASAALFDQLDKAIKGGEGDDIVGKMKGVVVFDIDGEKWTLDLRPDQRQVTKGAPEGKPDLTLTISDDNFVKLVMGKMGPQQAFLMRKLKIGGSMALALKLQPILDAAAPRAKL